MINVFYSITALITLPKANEDMNKPIFDFFEKDHRRIEGLLDKAIENPAEIDLDYYHQFRTGLLKHIKMEEKILFPAAQKANGGVPLPLQAELRMDHGAITSLMVVKPTIEMIKVLYYVMEDHDRKEEEPGGMYDVCENLTKDETEEILEELRAATEVPVHPFNEAEYVLGVAKRSLLRAGYDYDKILEEITQNEEF